MWHACISSLLAVVWALSPYDFGLYFENRPAPIISLEYSSQEIHELRRDWKKRSATLWERISDLLSVAELYLNAEEVWVQRLEQAVVIQFFCDYVWYPHFSREFQKNELTAFEGEYARVQQGLRSAKGWDISGLPSLRRAIRSIRGWHHKKREMLLALNRALSEAEGGWRKIEVELNLVFQTSDKEIFVLDVRGQLPYLSKAGELLVNRHGFAFQGMRDRIVQVPEPSSWWRDHVFYWFTSEF